MFKKTRAAFKRREPALSTLNEMQDEMMEPLLAGKSSAFIFRGRHRGRRKVQELFGRANRADQRLVLIWVTNRSAGR